MKGRWYQYSYLPSTQQEMYSDYQMVVTGVSKKSDPDTSVTYTRVRYFCYWVIVRYPVKGTHCLDTFKFPYIFLYFWTIQARTRLLQKWVQISGNFRRSAKVEKTQILMETSYDAFELRT